MAETPLALTLGAIQMGVVVSSVLWGVTCMQYYNYTTTGTSRDRKPFQAFVLSIFILESLHTFLVWIYLFDMNVNHFGDVKAITAIPWHLNSAFAIYIVISTSVQAFFGYRVFVLSRRVWLAVPSWLVTFARLVTGLMIVALLAIQGLEKFQETHHYMIDLSLALSTFVDVWNTTALVTSLVKAGRSTSFQSTTDLLNAIIALTMETGLVVVLVGMFELIAWIVAPHTSLWICALLIYARLYSNSLLVVLNMRAINSRKRSQSASNPSHGSTSSRNGNMTGGIVLNRTREVELATVDLPSGMDHDIDLKEMGSPMKNNSAPFSNY